MSQNHVLGLTKIQRDIGYYNYLVAFGFAIFLNGILAFAVAKRSTPILKSYKKVFIFHIIVDVSLALLLTLTMFQPIGAKYEEKSIVFHIVAGLIEYPPQPWTTIFACITLFFQIYNITTAPVSFIYRYLIICHNYEISIIKFLGFCLIAGIGPLALSLSILISELSTRHFENEISIMFQETDWIGQDGIIPAFGVMFTSHTAIDCYITPVTVIVAYSIVLYCTIKISKKILALNSLQQQNASGRNIRSQAQLQTVLYCQALIPFFTNGISNLALQYGKVMGLTQPWWYYYLNLLNTWSPVVNSLVALIVIGPYRKFMLHPFSSKINDSSTNGGGITKYATTVTTKEITQHFSKFVKVVN